MRKEFVILLFLPFIMVSCFKKLDGIDNLNTNIYDPDYAGDAWFELTNAFEFVDVLGNTKVKIEALIPSDATPGLKPSNFYYSCVVNSVDLGVPYVSIEEEEHYEIVIIVDPDISDNYAVTLGVWIEDDQKAINHFTETILVP